MLEESLLGPGRSADGLPFWHQASNPPEQWTPAPAALAETLSESTSCGERLYRKSRPPIIDALLTIDTLKLVHPLIFQQLGETSG
jgi:hypothetical protein